MQAVYEYTHPDTNKPDMAVVRYQIGGRKAFAQCHPSGNGWLKSRPEGKLPLYNRIGIKDAQTVIVCEGEKAVHTLTAIGIEATTSPMGAGKAALADWAPLKGKTVYLWPDNDTPGINHMADVRKLIEA